MQMFTDYAHVTQAISFADGETYDGEQRGGNAIDNCAAHHLFSYVDLASAFRLWSVPKGYALAAADVAFWVSNAMGYMTMGSYLKLLVRLKHRTSTRTTTCCTSNGTCSW